MKPFNLTRALKGAAVTTRSGVTVTNLHKFEGVQDSWPGLAGVLEGKIYTWFFNGSYTTPTPPEAGRRANQHTMDLFMGPEKRYMNVYQELSGSPKLGAAAYESASEAADAAKAVSFKLITTFEYEV